MPPKKCGFLPEFVAVTLSSGLRTCVAGRRPRAFRLYRPVLLRWAVPDCHACSVAKALHVRSRPAGWRSSKVRLEQAQRVRRDHEGARAGSGDQHGSNQNPHNFALGHHDYSPIPSLSILSPWAGNEAPTSLEGTRFLMVDLLSDCLDDRSCPRRSAPFVHPKLSMTAVTDDAEDFAARLDRARARSAKVIEARAEPEPRPLTDLRGPPMVPDRRFRRA